MCKNIPARFQEWLVEILRHSTKLGMEAIEGLRFLASLPLAGTGRTEGGVKTQPLNRFHSRLFTMLGLAAEYFDSDSQNLAGMFLHNSVDVETGPEKHNSAVAAAAGKASHDIFLNLAHPLV